jgi:hypothetical protein
VLEDIEERRSHPHVASGVRALLCLRKRKRCA